MVLQDKQAQQDLREIKVSQDHLDQVDHLDPEEQAAAQVLLDQLDLVDPEVPPGRLEKQVTEGWLVHLAREAQAVHPDPQDPRGKEANKDLLAPQDLQDPWDLLGLRARRETVDQMDLLVQ